ncbi:MAG: hypothetical protein IKC86_02535, partial [Prevotella sp.]|nr:hypothetical protein [Prevotella sp.]
RIFSSPYQFVQIVFSGAFHASPPLGRGLEVSPSLFLGVFHDSPPLGRGLRGISLILSGSFSQLPSRGEGLGVGLTS